MPAGETTALVRSLRGLVTDTDLVQAEHEWPGLIDYLGHLPLAEKPTTFLDLVWRFERWRERQPSCRSLLSRKPRTRKDRRRR